MERLNVHISRARWNVVVYYNVSCNDADEVMRGLYTIGCEGEDARLSILNLNSCRANNGITYSNYRDRMSVMVIGVTSSVGEFVNTFVHEIIHLNDHIKASGRMIIEDDEVSAYAMGDFAQDCFREIFGTY